MAYINQYYLFVDSGGESTNRCVSIMVESAGYWVGIYSSKSHLETRITDKIRRSYTVWAIASKLPGSFY